MTTLPTLTGVQHRFLEVGNGVTIHVAAAGPADGPTGNARPRRPAALVGLAVCDRAAGC